MEITDLKGQSSKLGAHTSRIQMRTEPKLLNDIDKLAYKNGLTRSLMIRLILKAGLSHLNEIRIINQ